MVDPLDALGPLERDVLARVWELDTATARELFARQARPGERAYTTLMTTLDRLFKKGLNPRLSSPWADPSGDRVPATGARHRGGSDRGVAPPEAGACAGHS